MARKKILKHTSSPPQNATLGDSDGDVVDISALAAVLAADYPLIDQPLIIALLSDYDLSSVESELPNIRDQLGILEATLVPDPDELIPNENEFAPSASVSTEEDDLMRSVKSLEITEAVHSVSNAISNGVKGQPGVEGVMASGKAAGTSTSASGKGSQAGSLVSDTTNPTSIPSEDGGFVDELELLNNLFPSLPTHVLTEALSTDPSLQAAIDHLLSIELIKEVARRGTWPGEDHLEEKAWEPTQSPLVPGSTPSSPVSRSSSIKGKARRKDITIPLVDTLQRKASPAPSRPSSRTASPSRVGARPPSSLSSPSPNAWTTIASLAAYLADVLSRPTSYFQSYLHSPKYHSAYSAVCASLENLPQSASAADDERAHAVLNDMYGTFLDDGSLQTQHDLELCVRVAGGDVATIMDLMDLLGEISLWPGDDDLKRYEQYHETSTRSPAASPVIPQASLLPSAPLPPAFSTERMTRPGKKPDLAPQEKVIPGAKPAPSSVANPTAADSFGLPSVIAPPMAKSRSLPGRQVHPLNWRQVDHTRSTRAANLHPYALHIPSYARGATPHDPTPGSLYSTSNPSSLSIEECLRRASAEHEKRHASIRLAGQHFKLPGSSAGNHSSRAVNGAISGTYALRARESAARAREWELQAARMLVNSQLDKNGHTIDLHHLTVHEAKTVVLEAVEKWYDGQQKAGFGGVPASAGAMQKAKTFTPVRGMTVVTGVGRHSAGQTGVLGPAVANVLEENGWRVERGESGRGYLVVKGRKGR